jgi:hypothetical protein
METLEDYTLLMSQWTKELEDAGILPINDEI